MKRLYETQKAFEESLAEVSSLSKTNNDLIKQKQLYLSTIDGLRICVKKMQESLKGTIISSIVICIVILITTLTSKLSNS